MFLLHQRPSDSANVFTRVDEALESLLQTLVVCSRDQIRTGNVSIVLDSLVVSIDAYLAALEATRNEVHKKNCKHRIAVLYNTESE
jgi:hypothetical protein